MFIYRSFTNTSTLQFMNIWSSSKDQVGILVIFQHFFMLIPAQLKACEGVIQRKIFRIMFHKILQWLTGDIPGLKRPHTFFEAWIRCKCDACYIPILCEIFATYPKNMQNICNTPKIAGYLQQTQKYAKYLQHTKKYSNYLQHTKNT